MQTTSVTQFISTARVHNTHEHMMSEEAFVNDRPDALKILFHNYMWGDLCVAGASPTSVEKLMDGSNPDITDRFNGIKSAWEACKLTGYGEAVSITARHFFGMEEINETGLIWAQESLPTRWEYGERFRLLSEVGNYDHIQIDDFEWSTLPETGDGDFFLKDLSWFNLASGILEFEKLSGATGVNVHTADSLREALAGLFAKYGPCAVAVKSPHAYNRSLAWRERTDAEVGPLIAKAIHNKAELTADDRLCLGDWCLARGVELSITHNLPFKIHTGYKAGSGFMDLKEDSPALLTPLLRAYPEARFVLMHTGYPFADETLGLAKHFPNVWIDLCWAWGLNPLATGQFVLSFIRSVPINKLFGFGGDVWSPHHSVGFGLQMRHYLARTLEAGVDTGDFSEKEALEIAQRVLQKNQMEFFDLKRVKQANLDWLSANGQSL